MSDDKSQRRPQDAQRVNIHEPYELKYWSERFGVTPEQLKQAVQQVGVMADDVQTYL